MIMPQQLILPQPIIGKCSPFNPRLCICSRLQAEKLCSSEKALRKIFVRQTIGINSGRYCSIVPVSSQLYASESLKDLRASNYCTDFSCCHTSVRDRGRCTHKHCRRHFTIQVMSSGSDTKSRSYNENDGLDKSTLPFKKSDQSNASIRVITLTIDGVSGDTDIKRLQTQIGQIDGIIRTEIGPLKEEGIRGLCVAVHVYIEQGFAPELVIRKIQSLDNKLLILPYNLKSWIWRGQKINYAVAGCGKPILLVHGFGGNAGHFAQLFPYLLEQHRVYAVDLLGFGGSDKPVDADYGPELWAELICDFVKEFAEEGAVLIGNSIGSLTVLAAAAMGGPDLIRGLVLLNCAGAMNRKGLYQDDPLIWFFSPIFLVLEYLLQKPRFATFLFDRFRTKDNVRKILEEQAYKNKESVTDQLIDILYYPSTLPGAKEVFVKVFTGNPGPRPEALMQEVSVPVLLLWGDSDIWTPVTGPVARFFKNLARERDNVNLYALPDVGHCPHDDRPQLAADYILPFLSSFSW